MSKKKEKQYNCRFGINGWHEIGCPHQKAEISDWEKEFEAQEFKKWFGVELNTEPINGRIVAEEKFANFATNDDLIYFHEKLKRFDEFVKEQTVFIRQLLLKTRQDLLKEIDILIAQEIVIAQKEGQSTSRLTSLAVKKDELK